MLKSGEGLPQGLTDIDEHFVWLLKEMGDDARSLSHDWRPGKKSHVVQKAGEPRSRLLSAR